MMLISITILLLSEGKASDETFDIIIQNGHIIDGTGNPWFKADVGIKDGKISQIDNLNKCKAKKLIDASGLIVAPGFIDIHTHTDTGLVDPELKANLNYLRQGVTTVIAGNCGGSPLPVKGWFETCRARGIGTNALMLVGEGNIRQSAMGGIFNRPPTPQELDTMRKLVAQAMEEGALGISTGLEYPPGFYTTTEELIELAKVVAQYGGIYTSHMRNQDNNLIGGITEVIRIAEESGCHGQVSHLKVMGQANWGSVVPAMKLIEEARARGVEIAADEYPYTAASSGLSVTLPQWVFEGGKMIERLQDPVTREKVKMEMTAKPYGWWPGWDKIVVASLKINTKYIGMSIQEIANSLGKDPYYTAFDLLIAEGGTVNCIFHFMSEKDVRDLLVKPWVMVCTDGNTTAFGKEKPHPRNYGSFPRVLGKYVREERLLTLEDAIRKMTSLPAQTVSLRDRGLIREGNWADIVIFDSNTIADLATYDNPHQYNLGVKYVLVNGIAAIEQGEYTGTLAGKALHHHMNKISN
jgi:N-acyl-D-amino-acid deacylase